MYAQQIDPPELYLISPTPRPPLVWAEPCAITVRLLEQRIIELPVNSALCWDGWQLGHREPLYYRNRRMEDRMVPRRFYDLRWGRRDLVGVEHYQQQHPLSARRVRYGLAELLAGWGWQPDACRVQVCPDEWLMAAHRLPRLFKLK